MSAQDNVSSEWSNREIGALWKRVAKNSGQKYLAGHVTIDELGVEKKLKVIVFQNKFKGDNEKAPDLRIYLKPEDEGEQKPATASVEGGSESSEGDLI
jgi:uncharacterized protein (DUF736 family)